MPRTTGKGKWREKKSYKQGRQNADRGKVVCQRDTERDAWNKATAGKAITRILERFLSATMTGSLQYGEGWSVNMRVCVTEEGRRNYKDDRWYT